MVIDFLFTTLQPYFESNVFDKKKRRCTINKVTRQYDWLDSLQLFIFQIVYRYRE